jgi:hypothetical protein
VALQVIDYIQEKNCLRIQQIIETRINTGVAACQEGFINNFIHSCCGYLKKSCKNRGLAHRHGFSARPQAPCSS